MCFGKGSCIQTDVELESSKRRQCLVWLQGWKYSCCSCWEPGGALQGLCSAGGFWATRGLYPSPGEGDIALSLCPSRLAKWSARAQD